MALEFDSDSPLMQRSRHLCERQDAKRDEIKANGGVSEFPALFDLKDNRVRAKLINGRYGLCWMFFDAADNPTGKFVKAHPARESTMTRKDLKEGTETAPAAVTLGGGGSGGLAGVFSLYVVVFRTDGGYPADAITA